MAMGLKQGKESLWWEHVTEEANKEGDEEREKRERE
jgi:hypothetical protein